MRWGAIAALLTLIGCTQVSEPHQSASAPPTISPSGHKSHTPPPLQLKPPTNPPRVNPAQLETHLQALVGTRYTATERDRVRQYLIRTLKQSGWQVSTQSFRGGANVLAHQPGHANAATLLLTAHFDTVPRSPGADDNASAVATVLEVAQVLRTHAATNALVIALFDQEEQGLLGSLAFTGDAANLRSLLGVINLEMVGYTCRTPGCQAYPENLALTPPSDRGDFLAILGDREHEYLLTAFQLARTAALPPILTLPIPLKGLLTPDVLRSDHAPFWANNIGAVMVTDTGNFRNPHYHQPTDTLDTLDLPFLTRSAQLVVNTVVTLLDTNFPNHPNQANQAGTEMRQ